MCAWQILKAYFRITKIVWSPALLCRGPNLFLVFCGLILSFKDSRRSQAFLNLKLLISVLTHKAQVDFRITVYPHIFFWAAVYKSYHSSDKHQAFAPIILRRFAPPSKIEPPHCAARPYLSGVSLACHYLRKVIRAHSCEVRIAPC